METIVRKRGSPGRWSPTHRREDQDIMNEQLTSVSMQEEEDMELQSPSKSSRRRVKRDPSKMYLCYMLLGVTALFGVSTIAIAVSRNGSLSPLSSPRRRLSNREGTIKSFTLSDSVRDELFKEVSALKVDTSNLNDLESFIGECKEIVQSHLTPDILEALQALHNTSSPVSAVLFHNIPVDPFVPATPTDGSTTLGKTTYVSEAMLVGLGELTSSHVIGYSAETQYSNPWIHEGFPRNSPGSALTKASELSFHQDMSYHPEAPDILGLVGVREGHDHHVDTELVDNREILDLLPESIVQLLREPRFEIKTSDWVDSTWGADSKKGRPVLSGAASLAIPVDWENMVGLDKEAEWAVTLLKKAIMDAPTNFVHFVPGDLLLFSNQRNVHARTPYKDLRYDGGDRVLYRAYFRKDWTAEERKTRMI